MCVLLALIMYNYDQRYLQIYYVHTYLLSNPKSIFQNIATIKSHIMEVTHC